MPHTKSRDIAFHGSLPVEGMGAASLMPNVVMVFGIVAVVKMKRPVELALQSTILVEGMGTCVLQKVTAATTRHTALTVLMRKTVGHANLGISIVIMTVVSLKLGYAMDRWTAWTKVMKKIALLYCLGKLSLLLSLEASSVGYCLS